MVSPNGVHFQIQCLYDGEVFHGVNINDCKDVLTIVLLDPEVCKIGHGVTLDAWYINESLKEGCVKNLLEAGRILRFLNKGEKWTGKETSSKLANFTDVFPNPARIESKFNPYRPGFFNFCRDPQEWFEVMHQYNRIDAILGLFALDHMTLFLCDFWGYSNGEFEDCSVALPRLMAILLLHDTTIYKGSTARGKAGAQGSNPMDAPVDFKENFQRTNPFQKTYMKSYYPLPKDIARELMAKQLIRNMPFTPVFYEIGMAEVAYFEPTIDIDAPLWYRNSDKITQINYIDLSHPHLCGKCGDSLDSNHDEKNCKEIDLLCRYPLCKGPHDTRVCPMILAKCDDCEIPGHKDTHHKDKNFDILKAFATQKLFSHVHTLGSLMNHKELTLVTDKTNFELFCVYPKKGYNGDHPKIDVQIKKKV